VAASYLGAYFPTVNLTLFSLFALMLMGVFVALARIMSVGFFYLMLKPIAGGLYRLKRISN